MAQKSVSKDQVWEFSGIPGAQRAASGEGDIYDILGPAGDLFRPGKVDFEAEKFGFDAASFRDPRAEQNRRMLQQQIAGAQGRQADVGGLQSLSQQLSRQAQGIGPSIANQQLMQGFDRSMAGQAGQAATFQGQGNAALAQRGLAQQGAMATQDLARQSGIQRLGEQQTSQQLLSGVQGQILQGQLQQQQISDAFAGNLIGAGLGIDAQGFAAQQEQERLKLQEHLAREALRQQTNVASAQQQTQVAGANASAVGNFASMLFGA